MFFLFILDRHFLLHFPTNWNMNGTNVFQIKSTDFNAVKLRNYQSNIDTILNGIYVQEASIENISTLIWYYFII